MICLRAFFFLCVFPFFLFCAGKEISYQNLSSKPLVILDAGHGGGLDVGARSKNPYYEEKRITLMTTLLTKRYLEQLGYRIILTRSKDFFVPLKRRVYVANKSNAEAFVSIHFNSCPNSAAKGIEIFYHQDETNKTRMKSSKRLASSVLREMTRRTEAFSRGAKEGNFCVIRETQMPAILIEGGFMTHPEEKKLLKKRAYIDQMAKGIAEGIDQFFNHSKKHAV